MNLPTIPTDNLYKFMALSGVALFLGSLFLGWLAVDRSQELRREYEQGLKILEARSRVVDLEAKGGKDSTDTLKHALREQESIYVDQARLTAVKAELEYIASLREWIRALMIVCQAVGTPLGFFGFTLWYRRVQKYQDMLLQRQAGALTAARAPGKRRRRRQET